MLPEVVITISYLSLLIWYGGVEIRFQKGQETVFSNSCLLSIRSAKFPFGLFLVLCGLATSLLQGNFLNVHLCLGIFFFPSSQQQE